MYDLVHQKLVYQVIQIMERSHPAQVGEVASFI